MMYVKIDKFLKSRVGKSFNDVYSEFRKKFPKYYGGVDLVEYFKDRFVEYQTHYWNGKYHSFYVEDGIIKDGYISPVKQKQIKINIKRNDLTYMFNQKFLKNKEIYNIIDSYLPYKYKHYLDNSTIFSERTRDIITEDLTTNKNIYDELANVESLEKYIEPARIYWDGRRAIREGKTISKSNLKYFLFTEINNDEYDIVELGSKEFIRNFEDNRKKKAKADREAHKIFTAEREALLHDLLQERKKKEKQENELIRDRHGFDDHSFKNW